MTLRLEGGDPAIQRGINDMQDRLDKADRVMADLQRRVENLERYTCGGRRKVDRAAKRIVVDPL